ncbi:sensor histidine kinase [Dokdonia ponticola]|uniref:Sensor histidine kinase n=1 Tax=Dokdonia ponticola TaxID=2041041 RepID=A0ABV9I0J6_9FLAO
MSSFLKKYKAFGIAAVLVALMVWSLGWIGFIKLPKDSPLETIIIVGIWWLVASFALYHFNYLKQKKTVVIKVLVLLIIALIIFGINNHFNVPDHPVVIFLMVLFWLGVFYFFFSKFFIKYKVLILLTYGLILCYFLYLRLDENYIDLYQQKALNLLIFPIPILFFIWAYEQWKWFNTLKSEKAKAELDLLKTQVNPHFLFNTLNNLYALTVTHSEKAPEVVLKLSDMLRYTIYEGKNDRVSIAEEITYMKNYMALHNIRHHKNVSLKFDHNTLPNDEVAPLLFIILLENAFKHGVEKLTDDAFITMTLNSSKKDIHFSITNNYDFSMNQNEKGIGIENLKRRLDLIYPDLYKLTINKTPTTYNVELIINK